MLWLKLSHWSREVSYASNTVPQLKCIMYESMLIVIYCLLVICFYIAGLLSLVLPNRSIIDSSSSLALSSLLYLLIMLHQNSKGTNPFREALNTFCDEHDQKEGSSFQFNLTNLYQAICKWVPVTSIPVVLRSYYLLILSLK